MVQCSFVPVERFIIWLWDLIWYLDLRDVEAVDVLNYVSYVQLSNALLLCSRSYEVCHSSFQQRDSSLT